MSDQTQQGSSAVRGVVRAKPRVPLGERAPQTTVAAQAGAANAFAYGGGRLLNHPRVHLIFWGNAWASTAPASPSVGACTDAVLTILASNYGDSLTQYGIGRGALGSVTVVDDPVGGSPADPPNPFSNDDIWQLVEHLRVAGRIPTGDIGSAGQGLYCVVVPPGVSSNQAGVIGEHSYYWFDGSGVHVPFAWVTQSSLDAFSDVFSHEYVEAATDPEGTGWTSLTACGTGHGGWCEIGDVCQGSTARVGGVLVQRYWSNADNQCVVPDDAKVQQDNVKRQKDAFDGKHHKDSKDSKDHKDAKEAKEGAKEKDGGAKEHEIPLVPPGPLAPGGTTADQLRALAQQLAGLADALDAGPGSESFIAAQERPAVGDS